MTAGVADMRRAQTGLSGLLIPRVRSLWDGSNINPVADLIRAFSPVAALNAADWYSEVRDLAPVRKPPFIPPMASPPSDEQIAKSLNWAAQGDDPQAILTKIEGAADKLVLDAGRDTVHEAVMEDPVAWGFARIPSPGACYFCAMLATRGAVYKTARSAGQGQQWHDHCHCVVAPYFAGQEYVMPEHVEKWEQLYHDSTGHVSGDEKIREFRRVFEGR